MRTALLSGAVTLLEERGARPTLIGAMALAVHGIGRSTQDVDLLVLDCSVLRGVRLRGVRSCISTLPSRFAREVLQASPQFGLLR